ncbi:MAG: hypothetical protein AAGD01_05335 [Acidobacteriota bacterium]
MRNISRVTPWALSLGLLAFAACTVFGFMMLVPADADASPCYGTRYDYFETSAHQVFTGTKVVCPGHPNQYDSGDNGGYAETSHVETTTVFCPCPGSGGGGIGGGDPYDMDEDP